MFTPFGSSNNSNSTNSFFGSTNSGGGNPQQQQQQPQQLQQPQTLGASFGSGTSAFGSTFGGQPQQGQQQSLFGSTPQTQGLFGQNPAIATTTTPFQTNSSPFGGGSFGSNVQQPQQQTSSLFGSSQNQSFSGSSSNLFGGASSIGAPPGQQKWQATTDIDNNNTNNLQTITAMPSYSRYTIEELRLEDYGAGRKGTSSFGGTLTLPTTNTSSLFSTQSQPSPFGASSQQVSGSGAFGSSNVFGNSTTAGSAFNRPSPFGTQPSTSTPAPSPFGVKPTGFGVQSQATPSPFGSSAAVTPSPFGSMAKPTPSPFGGSFSTSAAPSPFGSNTTLTSNLPQSKPFGFSSTAPTPTSSFGTFNPGSTQPQQTPFGFNSQPQSQFGSNFSSQTPTLSQQPTNTSALFASTTPQSSLFGSSAPKPSNSLFGGATQSSPFGSTPPPPPPQLSSSSSTSSFQPSSSYSSAPFQFNNSNFSTPASNTASTSIANPNGNINSLSNSFTSGSMFGGTQQQPPLMQSFQQQQYPSITQSSLPSLENQSIKPPIPSGLLKTEIKNEKKKKEDVQEVQHPSMTPRTHHQHHQSSSSSPITFRLSKKSSISNVEPLKNIDLRSSKDDDFTPFKSIKNINLLSFDAENEGENGDVSGNDGNGGNVSHENYNSDNLQYTKPSLEELKKFTYSQLSCVKNFIVGQRGIGEVRFIGEKGVDLSGIRMSDLFEKIIHFEKKQISVYPEVYFPSPGDKPSPGKGLNVKAQIRLDFCYPTSKATRLPIKEMGDERMIAHLERLKGVPGTHFIDFIPSTGTWIFEVDQF